MLDFKTHLDENNSINGNIINNTLVDFKILLKCIYFRN